MNKKLLITFFLQIPFLMLLAQDLHFSQFYVLPNTLNPAYTAKCNADYRFSGIHRRQWLELNTPYITSAINAEINFKTGQKKYNLIGFGITASSDQVGRNSENGHIYNNTHLTISAAYHTYIDEFLRHRISVGLQTGYTRKSLNTNGLYFSNQIENYALNTNLSNGENTNQPYINNLNVNIGVGYQFKINQKTTLESGFGVLNMIPNKESISNITSKLPPRFIFNSSAIIQLNQKLSLKPHFLYMNQAKTIDVVFGSLIGYHILNPKNPILFFGIFHRLNESIIPTVAMQYGNVYVGISYDYNIIGPKSLVNAQNIKKSNLGSIEFSIIYQGFLKRILPAKLSVPCGIL